MDLNYYAQEKILGFAYDPSKLGVYVGGEKVFGFSEKKKVNVRRGLDGEFELELFLQGTSAWVPRLRELLGHHLPISIQYPGVFEAHLGFEGVGKLEGVDMYFTESYPEFVFYFKRGDELV